MHSGLPGRVLGVRSGGIPTSTASPYFFQLGHPDAADALQVGQQVRRAQRWRPAWRRGRSRRPASCARARPGAPGSQRVEAGLRSRPAWPARPRRALAASRRLLAAARADTDSRRRTACSPCSTARADPRSAPACRSSVRSPAARGVQTDRANGQQLAQHAAQLRVAEGGTDAERWTAVVPELADLLGLPAAQDVHDVARAKADATGLLHGRWWTGHARRLGAVPCFWWRRRLSQLPQGRCLRRSIQQALAPAVGGLGQRRAGRRACRASFEVLARGAVVDHAALVHHVPGRRPSRRRRRPSRPARPVSW